MKSGQGEELTFWISYADLLSTLTLTFLLLYSVSLLKQEETSQKYQEQAKEYVKLKEEHDRFFVVQQKTIERLKEELERIGRVEVTPTGQVKIADTLLFPNGSSVLSPEGKRFLNDLIPAYLHVIYADDEFVKNLAALVIEGHASSVGNDSINMKLSQERAYAVYSHILDLSNLPHREDALKILESRGKGKNELVLENGKGDQSKSRRVELRFELKTEKLMERLIDAKSNTAKTSD